MSDIKLLECPFCGRPGEIEKITHGTYVGCYRPKCSNPCCFIGTVTLHKQTAITDWNKRSDAGRESLSAENERLSDALKLRECVECGADAFEISPVNQSHGFCWNCHKLSLRGARRVIEGGQ